MEFEEDKEGEGGDCGPADGDGDGDEDEEDVAMVHHSTPFLALLNYRSLMSLYKLSINVIIRQGQGIN